MPGPGPVPRLRQRQVPPVASEIQYERLQEDEHHTDVYQNPVTSTFLCLIWYKLNFHLEKSPSAGTDPGDT